MSWPWRTSKRCWGGCRWFEPSVSVQEQHHGGDSQGNRCQPQLQSYQRQQLWNSEQQYVNHLKAQIWALNYNQNHNQLNSCTSHQALVVWIFFKQEHDQEQCYDLTNKQQNQDQKETKLRKKTKNKTRPKKANTKTTTMTKTKTKKTSKSEPRQILYKDEDHDDELL